VFFGFIAIIQTIEGTVQARMHPDDAIVLQHFSNAAKALAFAVFFDGLDGGIARLTNTTSDFGRELDSLADVITFGIAPAVLAYVWGVQSAWPTFGAGVLYTNLTRVGYMVAFFYLLCGAVRLARFNVQTNPMPKNPGRPDRKYFVGMPIPAGAGLIAAIVYVDPSPIQNIQYTIIWLMLVMIIGLLMVSTWRYPSFKQLWTAKPRSPLVVLVVAGALFLLAFYSQPLLLALASAYVASGIAIRLGGVIRRLRKPRPTAPVVERHVG
jgi:CDP-diacylglycerol--serine O-phosphatidyltransferase